LNASGPSNASCRLVLASASPRRQSLLRDAGYEFQVHPADLDEEGLAQSVNLAPRELPAFLARAKGEKVAAAFPDEVVLAADTVVALGSRAIGKPTDAAEARITLNLLSGSTHEVITGVAVLFRKQILLETVRSSVAMKPLSADQIEAYIAGGGWQGKAGGYGIQDADPFIEKMAGCMTNIVGLPMTTTARLLRKAGIEPRAKK
jgi:septum formation protein